MQIARFAYLAGLLLLAFVGASAASADIIGVFTEVGGKVTILRDNYYFEATEGVEVEEQDLIEVTAEGSTQVEMVDGSILRLGPESRLLLSEYQVASGEKSVLAASLEVLSGWLRFAVAKLKREAKYEFNTPVLTVGIRGTEGIIEAENERGGLLLEEGLVHVAAQGEPPGRVTSIQVAAGQFIERRQGRPFRRLHQAPSMFRARLPVRLRRKAERRVDRLVRRRVRPRALRRMNQDDVRRYLREHAPMRQRLERRLKRPGTRVGPNAKRLGNRTPAKVPPKADASLEQRRRLEAIDRLIEKTPTRQRAQGQATGRQPAHRRQVPARPEASPQPGPQPSSKRAKKPRGHEQQERVRAPSQPTPARRPVHRVPRPRR